MRTAQRVEIRRASGHCGYQVAEDRDKLPADYGDYCYYDGLSVCGAGSTRNVQGAFDRALAQRYDYFLIFLWKPDTDGSTRRWLNPHETENEDEDQDNECPYCHGTGERE